MDALWWGLSSEECPSHSFDISKGSISILQISSISVVWACYGGGCWCDDSIFSRTNSWNIANLTNKPWCLLGPARGRPKDYVNTNRNLLGICHGVEDGFLNVAIVKSIHDMINLKITGWMQVPDGLHRDDQSLEQHYDVISRRFLECRTRFWYMYHIHWQLVRLLVKNEES